jgi:hypothetical protein
VPLEFVEIIGYADAIRSSRQAELPGTTTVVASPTILGGDACYVLLR